MVHRSSSGILRSTLCLSPSPTLIFLVAMPRHAIANRRPADRLSTVVNVAILVVLLVLLFGPSGIAGRWLIAKYEEVRDRRAARSVWTELVDAPSTLSLLGGDSTTMVMFMDYECPFCRAVAPAVSQAVAAGQISIVVRHLPLVNVHPVSEQAAAAAICSEQWEMFPSAHRALYTDDGWMTEQDWAAFSHSLGISDTKSFVDCITPPYS